MKKRTIGIILGIIAVAAVLFFVWPSEDTQETTEVETTAVTQQDFKEVINTMGVISPVETENFIGQGLVAEVNVEENSEVAEDDVLLTYADGNQFVAPFAGTVVELNVEAEEMDMNAQQNQPSLVLSNLDELEVVIELSKSEANNVEVDQDVELTYLNETYEGVVSNIDAVATNGASGGSPLAGGQSSPTLNATISFTSEDLSALIPGFDIDAEIITETTTDALAIPIESLLYSEDGTPYVFIVEDGVVREQEIETGIQEGVMIEVVSGLESGQEVVQLPDEELTDGAEVTVVNDEYEESNDDSDE
ncbi:MAG TPA: HlyD family efflux transporter periplasmic adaptor subunit [Atopostipes sp.]|nr:HlyD family efflux transporter periplasmic adaptor subunit [Atopostipes sp.]